MTFEGTSKFNSMGDGGRVKGVTGIVGIDRMREFGFRNLVIFDEGRGNVGDIGARV